jgi:hypothetical protein
MSDGAGAGAGGAGAGEGGAGADGGQQGTDGQQQQDAAAVAAAAAAAAQGGEGDGQELDASKWPKEAQEALQRVRDEAAKNRIKARDAETAAEAKHKELLDKLTQVLNPDAAAGTQVTLEQATKQVEAVTSERDGARVDGQLIAEAWAQGLDPAKLDFLRFTLSKSDTFTKLDPAKEGWRASLKELVTQAVTADTSLKASGAQGTGQGEFIGDGQGSQSVTREQFASMSLAEKSKLRQSDPEAYARLVAA